jgi:Ca2+-binding RTX toxin-like protein
MSLIERLEGRRLMSVSISTSPDGSVLMVRNAANVSVTEFDVGSARQVSVVDNSNPAGPTGVTLTGNFQTLVIIGTNGNDQILLNTFDLNAIIDGGNGSDFITAFIGSTATAPGTAKVLIAGGNGDDFITVDGSTNSPFTVQEQGTFYVDGGNGDDVIQILDPINVVVIPSRGTDTVIG